MATSSPCATGDATISKWGKDKLDANAEMWEERQRAYGLEREKDFWGPTGVAVDDENRIFVCESARNRVQVYQQALSDLRWSSPVRHLEAF